MLKDLKGVGPQMEKKLNSLGIYTEEDLVNNFPKSYINYSNLSSPDYAINGDICLFKALITKINKPVTKGKFSFVRIYGEIDNEFHSPIIITWYNQPYMSKNLNEGKIYTFCGKLKIGKKSFEFANPSFESETENSKFTGIQPVYITRGIIPQKTYREFVENILKTSKIKSVIPPLYEKEYNLMSYMDAIKSLHFPTEATDFTKAKERMFNEILIRRICAYKITKKNIPDKRVNFYAWNKANFEEFKNQLPFELNLTQTHALQDIFYTMLSSKVLNAILCGDVGSGKTVIACELCYFVAKNGFQCAVMAPTEILAKQHYDFFTRILTPLNIEVGFLSSNVTTKERKETLAKIELGEIQVVIGTHSLLNDKIHFKNLSFVVEDEQHRFGVAQRTELISKGSKVDLLTLSATPIPRSMQLIAYGETQVVNIGRRFEPKTKTHIVQKNKKEDMFKYIAAECEKGSQAYIVAPMIFDSEGIEIDSVESLYEEVSKYISPDKIGVLHGKLKSDAKEQVLSDYRSQRYKILISTTVVEVGIDVPNASIIAIMNADRFGLATLHQLRGRVGRNGQDAFCFLYTENEPSEGLKYLVKSLDGFSIAELDFELRGAGDIFGLSQSGNGQLDGLTFDVLQKAKTIADKINLFAIKDLVESEIKTFDLNKVSLN